VGFTFVIFVASWWTKNRGNFATKDTKKWRKKIKNKTLGLNPKPGLKVSFVLVFLRDLRGFVVG